jgi:hypothetical protein
VFRTLRLTCERTEKSGSYRQRFRSPLGTKAVIQQEINGQERGLKRAPGWPDCSGLDMPMPYRGAAIRLPRRGLRCVSDGQSRTAAPARAAPTPS